MPRFARLCGAILVAIMLALLVNSMVPGGAGNANARVAGATWGRSPLTATGELAYVALTSANAVAVIDTSSNTVVTNIHLGVSPEDITFSRDGSRAYVTSPTGNSLSVIDATNNTLLTTISGLPGAMGVAVSPDGARLYVATQPGSGSGVVSVVDTTSNSVVDTVVMPVGLNPAFLAIKPDGTKLYVPVSNSSDEVVVVDTATNAVDGTISAGVNPNAVALDPAGTRAYVTLFYGHGLAVLDTASSSLLTTISFGGNDWPWRVAVSPDGRRAYVSGLYFGQIWAVDTTTNSVIATPNIGNDVVGLAATADSSRVYVGNGNRNRVAVLDAATNGVLTFVATSGSAAGVAMKPLSASTPTETPTPTATDTSTPTPTATSTPTPTATSAAGNLVWRNRTGMISARFGLGVAGASNGKIYAIGGATASGGMNTVEEYDPEGNRWIGRPGMPTARTQLGVVAANDGKVYAIGGYVYDGTPRFLTQTEAYDPVGDTWTSKTGMNTGRSGLAVALGSDGKIYAVGGESGFGSYLGSGDVYDPGTDTWTPLPSSMAYPRSGLGLAAAANGKLYAIGGNRGGAGTTGIVEEYDPQKGTWTRKLDMPTPRQFLGVVAAYGKIYAIGGYDAAGNMAIVEEYDPEVDTWRTQTSLNTGRRYLGAAVATSGSIYAVGGYQGDYFSPLAAVEEGAIEGWPTVTPTATPTATPTETPTATATNSPTVTATASATVTDTPAGTSYDLAWTTKNSMPTARKALAVTALNDKIYAIGGEILPSYTILTTVQEYDPRTDTWTNRAGTNTPRRYPAATAADNGRIYVFGGQHAQGTSPGNWSGTVEEYDPISDTWTLKASMPTARSEFGVAKAANGKIYAIGGRNGSSGQLRAVEEYDPETNIWTGKASMPTGRSDLAVVAVPDGKIYALGGYSYQLSKQFDTVEVYDPATNTWATRASMPATQAGAGAVLAPNGRIYLIAGGASYSSIVQEYNPETNTWATRTSAPTMRAEPGAAVVDGKIYVIGGVYGSSALGIVEEATILGLLATSTPTSTPTPTETPIPSATATATETPTATATPTDTPVAADPVWTARASMSSARHDFGTVATGDGRVYAIGGFDPSWTALTLVEAYNPATDTWVARTDMPTARGKVGAALAANGHIYVVGGSVGSLTPVNTVEEYDPQTDSWRPKAGMHTARYGLALAAAPNGRLYAFGGTAGGDGWPTSLDSVEEYDPEADTWQAKGPMPRPAQHTGAVATADGKVYVIGGYHGPAGYYANVDAYDTATDTWSAKASMPVALNGVGAVLAANGKIYVVGGSGNPGYVSTVYEYNPSFDTWTEKTGISTVRSSPGAAVASNGRIYVMGGWTGSTSLALMEEGTIANISPIAPYYISTNFDLPGTVNTPYTYTASLGPIDLTWPVTYTWEATDQAPVVHVALGALALGDKASFTWSSAGAKSIRVTASNAAGSTASEGQIIIEDIATPGANCTWTGDISPDWHSAGNWADCGGAVPGQWDSALIPWTPTNQPSISSPVNVRGVTIAPYATLTAGQTGSLTASNMELNGTFTGGGTLTVSGILTWTNGEMIGPGATNIPSGGSLNISGYDQKSLSRTLNNWGTVTWSGEGAVGLSNGVAFNNYGLLEAQNDAYLSFSYNGDWPAFNNSGTFRKVGSEGTTGIGQLVALNNSGRVEVLSGTLSIEGGGMGMGSFEAATGATLKFYAGSWGGTYTLDAISSVSGAGVVDFSSGTVNVGGTYSVSGATIVNDVNATVSFNSSSPANTTVLSQTTGSLRGTGNLVATNVYWSGGEMAGAGTTDIPAGGRLEISGYNQKSLSRTTYSRGTAVWSGEGDVYFAHGAVFNNYGLLEAQNDAYFYYGYSGDWPTFNNSGTFRKVGSTGTTGIGQSVAFNNSGRVELLSGTLSIEGPGASSGGFEAAAGTTLRFAGSGYSDVLYTLDSGSTLSSAGVVEFSSGLANISGTYSVSSATIVNGGMVNLLGNVLSAGNFVSITSGVANFSNSSPISATILAMSDGQLTGSGVITAATINWSGGTMGGTGSTNVPSGGSLSISGYAWKTLWRTLNNQGMATWSGEGYLSLANGAVFNNYSLFEAQNDAYVYYGYSGDWPAFNNSGTFRKTGGLGTTGIGNPVAFNNNGRVEVLSGTLSIEGGGTSSGSFEAATGTTLKFADGSWGRPYTMDLNSTIEAANIVEFSSGMTTISGTYSAGGATIVSGGAANFLGNVLSAGSFVTITGGMANFSNGSPVSATALTLSDGQLAGSGVFTAATVSWTGGTMAGTGTTNIPAGGSLSMSGYNWKSLSRALNNEGTAIWNGEGSLSFADGAVFNNQGVFEARNDAYIYYGYSGDWPAFNNSGTFRKVGSAGTTDIGNPVAFNNTGRVEVLSGTLSIEGGGTSSGSFEATTGTTLRFADGSWARPYTLDLNSTLDSAGVVDFIAGTVNISGTYSVSGSTIIRGATVSFDSSSPASTAVLSQTEGLLTGSGIVAATAAYWSGGTMAGAGTTNVPSGGSLSISGYGWKSLSRTLNNWGTATWSGEGSLSFANGAAFNNHGLLEARNDAYIYYGYSGDWPTFNNSGTFRKVGSAGTTVIENPVAFNNTGLVEVLSGILSFGGGYAQRAGSTMLGGGNIATGSTLNILGGQLTGIGAITGNVYNAGQVSPGRPLGTISITGNYAQAVSGTLEIEIGGPSAEGQFDGLNVTGDMTLDGVLNISLANGFVPSVGSSYSIIDHGYRTGEFTIVNKPALGGNLVEVRYNPSNVTLEVLPPYTPTPTPSATATPSPTPSATASATVTPTPSATATPSSTSTSTPTPSATASPSVTNTPTPTASPSATMTGTPMPSATASPSVTATSTPTASPSATATRTPSPMTTASATATPTPSASATPTPTAGLVSLSGSVGLQGRGSAPNASWIVSLTVTLHAPGVLTPTYRLTTTTDTAGRFSVAGFAPGTYDVRVKKAHSLANLRTGLVLLSGNTFAPFGVLLEGDANEDGTINSLDYSPLASSYMRLKGEAGFDERVDFNEDGRINASDYAVLAANYFKRN